MQVDKVTTQAERVQYIVRYSERKRIQTDCPVNGRRAIHKSVEGTRNERAQWRTTRQYDCDIGERGGGEII